MFKFKVFLQKSFFRLAMLGAVLAFFGVFVYALKLEETNVPPETMRMPSESVFGRPVVEGQGNAAIASLEIQHMGSREVAMALNEIIAESLSFDPSNYTSVVSNVRKYFTPEGYRQYSEFLVNSAFQNTLATQNMQAGAYVDSDPVEMGRGVYDGAFKWLFEAPVTVSLIPRNATTYQNDVTRPQNRNFTLRVQMARVNDPQDPNAVKIELWQVLPPRTR